MFLALLTAAALLPQGALAAPVPKADYALKLDPYSIGIRDYQFPSGLRILFQEEHSQPIVAITLVFDRGSEFDQPGQDGIAHVVEHLAFRARHGDLPKNMDVIKQLGGSFNASTSVDWTNYMTVAPADSLAPLLRIEALRMKNGVANVTEQDVRTEAEIARNELRFRYENAAVGAAWDTIGQALFPKDHPYARSTIGSHETLSNIDLAHVQEYVQNNYLPQYTTMVVVGDFKLDDTWNIILNAFDEDLDLLMAPEDAAAYRKLTTEAERNTFLQDWVGELQTFMNEAAQKPPPSRVQCGDRKAPPKPQTQEIQRVKGMVDSETVVLAWSLPGGYCEDEPLMHMAGYYLTNYIYSNLYPTWEYQKQESALEGIGCFVGADEYNSVMYCFIEPSASAGYKPEKLIEKAADALYLQWDREQLTNPYLKAFNDWAFSNAKMGAMADALQSVDLVSSLGGRATATAMFTHFTGDAAYFSTNIENYSQLSLFPVQEFARQYLTRDRMVAVVVEPMDEEERARHEAEAKAAKREDSSAYHGTQEEDAFALLFDPDDLTPEAIERVTVTPDRSAIREFTLSNGLKVAVMPYGEAPLVRVGLQVRGSDSTSPIWGLNTLAESLYYTGGESNERLLAVAGGLYGGNDTVWAEGSSGNLDALLNKLRWQVEDYEWTIADKKSELKTLRSDARKAGKEPETWASRYMMERVFGADHPLGQWWDPEHLAQAESWTLDAMKAWIYQKWQPANAELVVVGKIDPAAAEAAIRKYFEGWEARTDKIGQVAPMARPSAAPSRQVLIFDKPIATQSEVTLACQAVREDDTQNGRIQVVGDVLSEMVWRTLREEAGVTYGAYAYPQYWEGGTAGIFMASLVQNDATGFATQTMLQLMDRVGKGEVDEGALASAKWSIARSYVLGQQSGQQMMNRLLGVDVGNFDYFEHYPKDLARVTKADFPTTLAPCVGHEVITIVGPKEYAEAQLKERGIAYEVVDWEKLYESQLTKKELKKYREAKAKEEAEKKKAAG